MAPRRTTIGKRRAAASDGNAKSAPDTNTTQRLAAVEKSIADLRLLLEVQYKRIESIQAQLDHLIARRPV